MAKLSSYMKQATRLKSITKSLAPKKNWTDYSKDPLHTYSHMASNSKIVGFFALPQHINIWGRNWDRLYEWHSKPHLILLKYFAPWKDSFSVHFKQLLPTSVCYNTLHIHEFQTKMSSRWNLVTETKKKTKNRAARKNVPLNIWPNVYQASHCGIFQIGFENELKDNQRESEWHTEMKIEK